MKLQRRSNLRPKPQKSSTSQLRSPAAATPEVQQPRSRVAIEVDDERVKVVEVGASSSPKTKKGSRPAVQVAQRVADSGKAVPETASGAPSSQNRRRRSTKLPPPRRSALPRSVVLAHLLQEEVEVAPKQTIALRAEVAHHPHQPSERVPRSTSQRARSSPSHRVVEHRKDHEDTKDGEATPVQREGTAKHKPKGHEVVQAVP